MQVCKWNWERNLLTQQTLAATLGSAFSPSTIACNKGLRKCSLMTASGRISQTRPTVHAAVSRTTTLVSLSNSKSIGIADSTIGFRVSGFGPSRMEPKTNKNQTQTCYIQNYILNINSNILNNYDKHFYPFK